MIRGKTVTVSIQSGYDQYHERHARAWEAYYAGETAGELGIDQEVAEGRTKAVGEPRILAELGLTDGPSPEQLTKLGAGFNPNAGEQLVGSRPGFDRVAYKDLVFSVPKSVSVEFAAARAAGDEARVQEIVTALEDSARAGLSEFERLLPLARRGSGKEQRPAMARTASLFNLHSAARPIAGQTCGDPHLHVHMRVLNLAKGVEDGEWSSVNYYVIFNNIRVLNGLVEAEFQHRLRTLGYGTEPAEHGDRRVWQSFELTRRDEALMAAMGSRQVLIEAKAQELWDRQAEGLLERINVARVSAGLERQDALTFSERSMCKPTVKQVQAISRASREDKLPKTRRELAEAWGEVITSHGYEHLLSGGAGAELTVEQREQVMDGVIARALSAQGMTESRSVWSRADLLESLTQDAVRRGLPIVDVDEMVRTVELSAVKLPGTRVDDTGAYSTVDMIQTEEGVRDYFIDMADQPRISVPAAAVEVALEAEASRLGSDGIARGLDPEQERALRAICSPAGWAGVVGVAGAGKTTTCRPAIAALEASGYQVLAVALSGGAAQVLEAETGAASWNIADFLTRVEHNTLRDREGKPVSVGPKTILLIDEAGTVDSRTMGKLADLCRTAEVAAVRNIGDPRQTQPVGAGGIFGWLSRHLPASYLTVNYRQGETDDTHEVMASRLIREGRGYDFLQLKDRAGLLTVDATLGESVQSATRVWADAIQRGENPRDHVVVGDLNLVVDRANEEARAALHALGRLGDERLTAGLLDFATGDRIALRRKHVRYQERLDDGGVPMLRSDGTPRLQKVTLPKRARGEVIAVDAAGGTLTVRTDGEGRLPSRTVELTSGEAEVCLGRGYAMTTAVAQGRNWDTTYAIATGSRMVGVEQTYTTTTRSTRATRLFLNSETVHAEETEAVSLRDDTIERMGVLMSRPGEKVTTLDYASEATRAALEQRLTPRFLRVPKLDAPMTERQGSLLARLGVVTPDGETWTWVRASAELDRAHGAPVGTQAGQWLEEHGLQRETAERRVNAALRKAGVDVVGDALRDGGPAVGAERQVEPTAMESMPSAHAGPPTFSREWRKAYADHLRKGSASPSRQSSISDPKHSLPEMDRPIRPMGPERD